METMLPLVQEDLADRQELETTRIKQLADNFSSLCEVHHWKDKIIIWLQTWKTFKALRWLQCRLLSLPINISNPWRISLKGKWDWWFSIKEANKRGTFYGESGWWSEHKQLLQNIHCWGSYFEGLLIFCIMFNVGDKQKKENRRRTT